MILSSFAIVADAVLLIKATEINKKRKGSGCRRYFGNRSPFFMPFIVCFWLPEEDCRCIPTFQSR